MKKYVLSLLTLSMALSSGMAFAEGGVGEIATAQADITFTSPSTISHEVMPVAGLQAGAVQTDTTLATGTVSLMGTLAKSVAVTFNNGTSTSSNRQIIPGKVEGNQIVVGLVPSTSTGTSYRFINNGSGIQMGGNSWTNEQDVFSYMIKARSSSSTQTVNPDIYTIQLSAQRWED